MIGMRAASRCYIGALSFCVSMGANAAAAQERPSCIAPALERALTACPEGTRADAPSAHGRRALPRSSAPPSTRTAAAPPAPSRELEAHERLTNAPQQVRDLQLLDREREILERLVLRTPLADPQRPEILRRLAETLGELVRQAETEARSLDEPIFRARGQAPEARLVRRQAEAEQRARERREAVIRVLAQLAGDHPSYRRADEALYSLAYHLERMDQRARARQAYQRLIRDFSASRYVPHAYLAFAEHAFEQGRLEDARELYGRVLSYPAEENPLHAYARYKLAWVHFNAERFVESLAELVRLLEHVRANPNAPDASELARQARRDLVLPYARVGAPARALAFFRRVGEGEDEAFGMLERLGELYLDTGRWGEAISVHHQLMAERPRDAALCAWQARVLDATISARPKDDQLREARRLADVRARARAQGHPDAIVRACDERTATALVLLATAWHREAVGTEEQPGTRDGATMERAAQLYTLIERELPELDSLTLSDLAAADRPTRAHVAFFHGELLFDQNRWAECAQAYERALDASQDAQLSSDAAYGAVVCYDRHLGARAVPPAPSDRALSARELTDDEARTARTFARFACAAPSHDELPIVLYRWARLYYEANRFDEAASLFGRVATEHARSEVSEYAANLYLDSLNVLASRRGREACGARLAASIEPLESAYCESAEARALHPALCGVIDSLRCSVEAQHARDLGREGRHRESAEAYVRLVRVRTCAEEDVYLYNAALEYEAVRLVGRAIRVRTALIEAHPESPLARRSVYLVGANYHALTMYEPAADWYERYASASGAREETCTAEERARGECADASLALESAVTFRLGLGMQDRALEDARRFERLFSRRDPGRTAEVLFAIGSVHADAADWPRVAGHYGQLVRRFGAVLSPDRFARAHVLVARAHIASGDRARAASHLEAAVEAHARAGEGTLPGETDEARALALARLRDAASEALFELAEAERERFEAIPFLTLRGQPTVARVNRWAAEELQPWFERKLAALRLAEEAYGRVHPLGIPRWRIASASRIGDMIHGLVERVRGSPVPSVIEADPDLLATYWEALDTATEPYLAVAVQRYERCLETATQARWFDDRSRRCEEALNQLDAVRFPIASELRGRPEWEPRRGAEPGAPALDPPRDG